MTSGHDKIADTDDPAVLSGALRKLGTVLRQTGAVSVAWHPTDLAQSAYSIVQL